MATLCGKNDSILIVDDDYGVRDFLMRFFAQKGYHNVHTASNGTEALALLRKEPVKLVLCDVKLPGMSGLEILREIRAFDEKIGVIMITGFPEDEIAKQAIREGAYDYLVKPFDLSYLEMSVLTKIILTS